MLTVAAWGLAVYFAVLLATVVRAPGMFFKKHGKKHRLMGLWHLFWLVLGTADVLNACINGAVFFLSPVVYDLVLGCSGIALTVTAAVEFKASNDAAAKKNVASGVLHKQVRKVAPFIIECLRRYFSSLSPFPPPNFLPATN